MTFPRLFSPDRPAWRDAWLWCLPALVVGLLVRLWLLKLLPHAFYGLDSYSYFAFPSNVLLEGSWEFPDKRRWLFPLILSPAFLAGFKPLFTVLVLQKLFALLTLPALAYALRKTTRFWKWLVVPATLLWTLLPMNLNFEQQVTGHVFMVGFVMWSLAGWCSWSAVSGRSHLRWHAFFVPLGLAVLTKPVAWFLLPGLALGLLLTGQWRRLHLAYLPLLLAVLFAMKFSGSELTKYRHLLGTAFPLIRLDTKPHADLKREAADLVQLSRAALDHYYIADEGPQKDLIENTDLDPVQRPAWAALSAKRAGDKRIAAYRELAWEGIRHEPWMLGYISAQRAVFLLRQGFPAEEMSGRRDDPAGLIKTIQQDGTSRPQRTRTLNRLYGRPRDAAPPDGEALYAEFYGGMRTPEAQRMFTIFNTVGPALRFVSVAPGAGDTAPLSAHRPTLLGLLMLAGLAVGAFGPSRRALLPWALAWPGFVAGSLMLISGVPLRQLSPILPLMLFFPWVAVDALLCLVRTVRSPHPAPAG